MTGFVLRHDRAWLISHADQELNLAQQKTILRLVVRRIKHEPLAYLLGEWEFFGRKFFVNKRTLIPRPETEEMVQTALHEEKTLVWDVGTGSGVIAVTMALEGSSAVIASDINAKALAIAKKNAHRHRTRIRFIKDSLLGPSIKHELAKHQTKRLIVLANLPYLPMSDKKVLSPEVTRFEPVSALFTKDDGMFLIKKLLQQLASFHQINQRTLTILAEIDPPQAERLKAFARASFPQGEIKILKDSFGRKRILKIKSSLP